MSGGRWPPDAVGFEEDLACQGYRSASDHLYVMAQLSRWMGSERLGAADLSVSRASELCRTHQKEVLAPQAFLTRHRHNSELGISRLMTNSG